MNSTNAEKLAKAYPLGEVRKPYIAPSAKRLTPEEAKELLLRHAGARDPDVSHMLDRIEELQRKKGS